MRPSRRKKKNLKEKEITKLKDPTIGLGILIEKAKKYLEELNTEPGAPSNDTIVPLKMKNFEEYSNETKQTRCAR